MRAELGGKTQYRKEEYHVLFGFEASHVVEVITPLFREKNLLLVPFYVHSRIGLMEHLDKNPDTDAIVIVDRMPSGKLTAEEICYLAEKYKVQCVPLLAASWRGTAEMEKLYRRGILRAEFYETGKDAGSDVIREQGMAMRIANELLNGRNHDSAKAYYEIVGRVV